MKNSRMLAAVHTHTHTGNQINEQIIINNEEINNINAGGHRVLPLQTNRTQQNTHLNAKSTINNERVDNIPVGADASVRPLKGNNQKGITLLALIITIIVLLILSVVSIRLITQSGIIEKAKLSTLKHEIAQYDEELKLYIVAHREVNENPINTSGYENMKKYIPSFKKKYEEKLKIINNKLVYMNDNVTEAEKDLFNKAGISSDEKTQIYYLDENNQEKVLEVTDGTISETTYTSQNIAKEKITKLIIGSSCTKIGAGTFGRCESINTISANTTKTIEVVGAISDDESGTFECKNLKSVIFSNITMTAPGLWNGKIFSNCTNLQEVTLGSIGHPVTRVQARTFENCTQKDLIIRIYVKDSNELLYSPWGATNSTIEYYSATTGELVNVIWGTKYSGNTQINWTELPNADKITVIRANAFDGCENLALTSLPSNLETIEKEAFKNCKKLAISEIPSTCKKIDVGAFNGCESINTISANTTKTIEVVGAISDDESGTFECKNLKSVIFSNITMTAPGLWNGKIFSNCTNLQEVTLGSIGHPVTRVQARTFENCTQKDLIIRIYVKDSNELLYSPWGATNSAIEYYSATTGEKIK